MDKIVHTHIPKTAGTSLLKLFQQWYPNNVELTHTFPEKLTKTVTSGHFPYQDGYEHYKWVTFVRHPIDRLMSFYHYTKSRGHRSKRNYWWNIMKYMTLEEWLNCDESKNHMTKQFAGLTPQDDLSREDINRAYKNVSKFYFIGLQENFNSDVRKLSFMLGKRIKGMTPHMLTSKNDGKYNPKLDYGNTQDVILYDYIKLLR